MSYEPLVPVVVFVLTWMVGLELRWADMRREIRGASLLAIASSFVILPALGFLMVFAVPMPQTAASGILLMCLCPAGGLSNVYAMYARSDVPMSVMATGFSCLMGFVTIPLWLKLCASWSMPLTHEGVPFGIMALQLLITLVLPIGLGIVSNQWWPEKVAAIRRYLPWVGVPMLGGLVCLVLVQAWDHVVILWPWAALLTGIMTVASAAMGIGVAALCRLNAPRQLTLGIEYPVRHLGIAVLLAINVLGRPEFAGFAAVAFLVQLPLIFGVAWGFKRCVSWSGDPLAASSGNRSDDH